MSCIPPLAVALPGAADRRPAPPPQLDGVQSQFGIPLHPGQMNQGRVKIAPEAPQTLGIGGLHGGGGATVGIGGIENLLWSPYYCKTMHRSKRDRDKCASTLDWTRVDARGASLV